MNENDFNQLENPNMENTNESNTTFEEKVMEPARAIDAPIEEPIIPTAPIEETKSIDNGGKKKNPLTIVVIILLILLLAALGYIAYDRFFPEPKEDKDTTKDVTDKDEKEEVKEQVINYDFSKYKTTVTTTPVEAGTVTIKGKDYKITFMRYDCSKAGQLPSECSDAFNYLTDISVSSSDGTLINNIRTDKEIDTIAVLDDRYLFIDTGDRPDVAPQLTSNLLILDSENKFADIHNIESNPLQKYSLTFRSYFAYNNGQVVEGSEETRKVGYVDKNTIRIAKCEKGSANSQKYVEYIVTIKDGEVSEKQDFVKDGVYCTAQVE